MDKKINREVDTTKFVNIDSKKFVFYLNNEPREIEAGEEKVMPIYVAELGAKHLIDLILQRDHGIKDTLKETPLRSSLLAKIIPELPDLNPKVKKLTPEEEKEEIRKELAKQAEAIEKLSGKLEGEDEKDKKIKELEEKLNQLLAKKVAKK